MYLLERVCIGVPPPRNFFPVEDRVRCNLTLIRGDTYKFSLFINENKKLNPKALELSDDDIIYFGIIESNKDFSDAIVKKAYSNKSEKDEHGNIVVCISSEDTEHLIPGDYYYQVVLKRVVDGKEVITTIIPQRPLFIID